MKKDMLSKILVMGVIVLFVGVSVVSSTERTVDDNHSNYHPIESNIESKEILSRSDIAYGYISDSGSSGHPEGPCYFYLDDPGNIYSLAPTESPYSLSGGTWTSDGIWYGWEYNTGSLWTINPNNGEMRSIGGGAGSCNGLSWDPVNNRLYGVSDSALFEINHENGEQELICKFNGPWYPMGIAFDGNGTLYGWFNNLWIMEACELTLVGPLGIWAEYGHFDYDTDILYLSTYISTGQLYECDEETGNCTLIGDFEGGAKITCLAIPYDTTPPVTTHSFNGTEGDNGIYISDVEVTLNATDDLSGVNATYYYVDVPPIPKRYTEPFMVTGEATHLVAYYSDDNAGNVENWHFVSLPIDLNSPEISLSDHTDEQGFTIYAYTRDTMSGEDRVEFYIDDELKFIDNYYPFEWNYKYPYSQVSRGKGRYEHRVTGIVYDKAGHYASDEIWLEITHPYVVGFILNPEISEENVTFFALIVLSNYGGIHMFKHFNFQNDYTGYIGRFFINATFNV